MEEIDGWLALLSLPRPRPAARELFPAIREAGSPQAFLSRGGCRQTPASPAERPPETPDTARWLERVNWGWVERMREVLERQAIELVPFLSPCYPPSFLRVSHPPVVLFCRGKLELLAGRAVAIVGTRRATVAGRGLARQMGSRLGEAGLVVVSGLAEGIDAAAHEGALAAGGDTLAVLGCGVDVPFPRKNRDLQEEIAQRGLLVSEFPPGAKPRAHQFPQRNRLVSARADGVVIVEAGSESGALITASYARKDGKPVMAVPGAPGSPESVGCNRLIKSGEAQLVESAADVAGCLGFSRRESPGELGEDTLLAVADRAVPGRAPESASERELLRLLGGVPIPADCLAREARQPVSRVLGELLRLEMLGLVEAVDGGATWRRARNLP